MQLPIEKPNRLRRNDDEGQDLLEYAMLMSLIAVVAMAGITTLGDAILNVFWTAIAAASV